MRIAAGLALLMLAATLALSGCSVVDSRVVKRWTVAREAGPGPDDTGPTIAPILPVIFLPGAKGSILKRDNCDDGKKIWGSTRVAWLSSLDDLLVPLPSDSSGINDTPILQDIVPCRIVADFDVRLFIPFQATLQHPIYKGLREILEKAGGFDEGNRSRSITYFDYDWRQDTRLAALELAARLPQLREEYYDRGFRSYCQAWKQTDVDACRKVVRAKWPAFFTDDLAGGHIKFNIVTHSLGGLVARYLIRGLGHGPDIYHLVLLGSPTEGAMFPLQVAIEGETPLGEILLHFYDKKETRPVGISFPSLFQALPRYAGALRKREKQKYVPAHTLQRDLGLTDEPPGPPAGWEAWAKEAAGRWFGALDFQDPSWRLICARSKIDDPGECANRMRLHLERELLSSVLFQQTLNRGLCGRPGEDESVVRKRQDFEAARIKALRPLLPRLRKPSQKDEGWRTKPPHDWESTAAQSCEPLSEVPTRENPTEIHQFFGHCDATPTWATVTDDTPLTFEFCGAASDACEDFGDQRIPRRSAQALRRHGRAPIEFLLCVEHTAIVKDPIVQDNLIRILLGDRVELTPVAR
jgi:pimeloyl-ACP methyl ester carboxylesterase